MSALVHRLAAVLKVDAIHRDKVRSAWRRLIHWKPPYYRRASEWGLVKTPRKPLVVITLTTYPARIGLVHETINTLLTQTVKPDKIVLWLAESQFPEGEDALPAALLEQKNLGLEIDWCEDLRSYKKLIPALRKYPDEILVTVDDDMFYPPEMLAELLSSYERSPANIHTQSAMRIEYDAKGVPTRYRSWKYVMEAGIPSCHNLTLGGSGTLYPPHSLDREVLNVSAFQSLAPTTDDIWFWAMAVKAGCRVVVAHPNGIAWSDNFNADQRDALWNSNQQAEDGNDAQFAAVLEAYPEVFAAVSRCEG